MKRIEDLGPGDIVTAISLWEPWASLMATGAKTIETRSWATGHRGPLLICASKRKRVRELRALLADPAFKRGLAPLVTPGCADPTIDDLAFGMAVCLVDLRICLLSQTISARIGSCARQDELHFGDYSHGRFGWVTRHRRRIKPFPVRGEQGLFRVQLPQSFEAWS